MEYTVINKKVRYVIFNLTSIPQQFVRHNNEDPMMLLGVNVNYPKQWLGMLASTTTVTRATPNRFSPTMKIGGYSSCYWRSLLEVAHRVTCPHKGYHLLS